MNDAAGAVVVACAADRNYAMPLAVALRSVELQLGDGQRLVAHAVDDGIAPADRRRVEESLSPATKLVWHSPVALPRAATPTWSRMPTTTYQKLALGQWLPQDLTRVIWLDGDVLALRDLGELWRTPLAGRALLAAGDELVPTLGARFGVGGYRELGLPAAARYFNAGVLLVDLERWRTAQVAARAQRYLETRGSRVLFWDQEALNAVLAGHWGDLDPRWNRNALLSCLFPEGRGAARLDAPGRGKPWIVHYCGRMKPWIYDGLDAYQADWYRALDATAWAGFRPVASRGRRLAVRYARSGLRRRLFALEQIAFDARRRLSRWLTPPAGRSA